MRFDICFVFDLTKKYMSTDLCSYDSNLTVIHVQ